jgi:hypothetical protein
VALISCCTGIDVQYTYDVPISSKALLWNLNVTSFSTTLFLFPTILYESAIAFFYKKKPDCVYNSTNHPVRPNYKR